jgi:cytochrome c nitrite reductase small subunit
MDTAARRRVGSAFSALSALSAFSAITLAILVGAVLGLGVFTFGYARGSAYLTNDPAACANCHIMSEHFAAWTKSSHRQAATCNDCHTPHSFLGKYATKASNGFWHSFYFTTGRYPDPLRITPRNHDVTEGACRSCHAEIVAAMDHGSAEVASEPVSCVRRHATVGHWVR